MIYRYKLRPLPHPFFEINSIVNLENRISNPVNKSLKRVFDMTFAVLFLTLVAPWLFPIVSLLIVIDSKGSPFFIQKRTGLNRKTFLCVKFRTMEKNKDANRLQVQVDDKRITRLGKFLRENHIDELPQILNVIWGNMSIIGPRPHMLRHSVEYAQMSPNYHLRHNTKPGMTGLAQVRGYHGMIANEEDYSNRLSSDLEYIENWTLWGDIVIFVMTGIKILFRLDK